ncbi:hypothetical protein ACFLS0_01820 [Candidatus Bipolaricaulota bacterium]
MRLQIVITIGVGVLIILAGCSDASKDTEVSGNPGVVRTEPSVNSSPASYISDVVTYAEGHEAFVCYFVLKDSYGRETANSGAFTIKVSDHSVIYSRTLSVTKSSFRLTTVGQGPYERECLLYYVGRITYSEFTRLPSSSRSSGTVSIKFYPEGGEMLYGEDTLYFD